LTVVNTASTSLYVDGPVPTGVLNPEAIYSFGSHIAPAGLILKSSPHGEAVSQWILNRPARGSEEAFKDGPIEMTVVDADPCEPVLDLSVQGPNV
jgi:hypothetical protein